MFKLISNLQKKPDAYRKKVTILTSLAFTIIIIIFWLTALFSGGLWNKGTPVEVEISVKEAQDPMDSIRSLLGSSVRSLKGVF